MAWQNDHSAGETVWIIARRQHGVISRSQLQRLGLSQAAIEHRVARGRLHPAGRTVYAVGRPGLTRRGRWMAATLSCGPRAVLSHGSGAALWGFGAERSGGIEVSVPSPSRRRQPGVLTHRRALGDIEVTVHDGIPVTTPACTLVDLASRLDPSRLERAVNEADRLDLIDPESLREVIESYRGRRGVARVRELLDRRTFRMTDSELERRFLPLVDAVGLPRPVTRRQVNGFRVDFYWPDLGLVVETDGLRYHRTPAQQARDRLRDQAHTAAGTTSLRFTHEQVRFEAAHVSDTLKAVARRLEERSMA